MFIKRFGSASHLTPCLTGQPCCMTDQCGIPSSDSLMTQKITLGPGRHLECTTQHTQFANMLLTDADAYAAPLMYLLIENTTTHKDRKEHYAKRP